MVRVWAGVRQWADGQGVGRRSGCGQMVRVWAGVRLWADGQAVGRWSGCGQMVRLLAGVKLWADGQAVGRWAGCGQVGRLWTGFRLWAGGQHEQSHSGSFAQVHTSRCHQQPVQAHPLLIAQRSHCKEWGQRPHERELELLGSSSYLLSPMINLSSWFSFSILMASSAPQVSFFQQGWLPCFTEDGEALGQNSMSSKPSIHSAWQEDPHLTQLLCAGPAYLPVISGDWQCTQLSLCNSELNVAHMTLCTANQGPPALPP